MLKALLKKQAKEIFSGYFVNSKTGKARSKVGIIGYFLLFAGLLSILGLAFFSVAVPLCEGLCAAGLGWFYFSLMGLLAIVLSIFGSVFNTYSMLYLAKDNELLLSMPIKPSKILFVRMISVFGLGLIYEAIVYIPSLIAWFIYGKVTVLSAVYSVLLMFVLAFVSLVLTCILGFLVAIIVSRVKNKSIVTVVLSIGFIVGYYFVYFNIQKFLGKILAVGPVAAAKLKSYAYITYIFGKAATGDTLNMLIFVGISAVLLFVTYYILSKFFMKTVTHKVADKSAKSKKSEIIKPVNISGVKTALLKREFKHFASTPIYILNCGLGILFMVVAAVVLIVKSGDVNSLLLQLEEIGINRNAVPVICSAIICLMNSTCYFTAPSVSLEGSNLWILKTLPIDIKDIFESKQKMHLILSAIPTVLTAVVCAVVLKFDIISTVFMTVLCLVYIQFISASGLILNLKMPNFEWTNESVPVKQSAPVTIVMFGGWAISVGLGVAYYFLRKLIDPQMFFIYAIAVFVLITRFINRCINTKGTEMFREM